MLFEVVLGTVIGYCISFFKIRCSIIFFTLILLQSFHLRGRMQSLEKLCLKWNDFQENLISAFRGFRNDLDFADVTLACEDGTHIEARKIVLASSSRFFMEMLKKNKHTLIYMRGIKTEDLAAMVDYCVQYVYIGNVVLWRPHIPFQHRFHHCIVSGTRLQLIVEYLKYKNTCIFDDIEKEKDEQDDVQTDHANTAKV